MLLPVAMRATQSSSRWRQAPSRLHSSLKVSSMLHAGSAMGALPDETASGQSKDSRLQETRPARSQQTQYPAWTLPAFKLLIAKQGTGLQRR